MSDEKPLVENSADRKQVRTARKRARSRKYEHTERVRRVLEDRPQPGDGLKLLREYIGFAGVFLGGRAPTEELQFREGQRNVGLRILVDVEQAKPDLISIMKEQING